MSSAQDPREEIHRRQRERRQETAEEREELVLSPDQSLQSIAVELHRANLLTQEQLKLTERQNDLLANVLDLLRSPPQFDGGGMADAMREFTQSFMGPIGALLADAAKPRAPHTESLPSGPPPPITNEKAGTRVEQKPGE